MMLSDTGLHTAMASGELAVDPIEPGQVQPASIDLRLDFTMRFPRFNPGIIPWYVDPCQKGGQDEFEERIIDPAVRNGPQRFPLPPHGFALASTIERVDLGPGLAAQVAGKSSLARIGLAVESAGFVDPGWSGQLTLELFNFTDRWIQLTPGMRIAQLVVFRLDQPARRPYGHRELGSHYMGQTGPTESRAHL